MPTKKKTTTVKKTSTKKVNADIEMKRHLINKYRGLVAARYDYKAIKNHPDMPEGITPEIVDSLKGYFLGSLYPEPETREKLDAAFAELENYVLHPAKVWDILGNLTSAIFKFGLQFPSALRAGLISLEAYTSAKHFENTLLAAALKGGYKIPVSDEEFYECLTHIPKPELEKFIEELSHLFRSFTNTELLGKTIGIMEDVLARMKSKPDLYGENEVEAIELGLDIMRKGHALFVEYDDEMKEFILQFIANNERNFIESLYEAKET